MSRALSHSTPAAKAKPWLESHVYALARQPGRHLHPTEPGFLLRVSPKLKAVFAYKFRAHGREWTDTLGTVLGTAASTGSRTAPDTGITLADALDRFQRVKERALAGPQAPGITLGQAFPRWLAEHRKRGGQALAPATVEYYSEAYDRYLSAAANQPLSDAGPDFWRGLLMTARGKSPSQARGTYWMLHALYAHFVQLGVLTENPLARDVLRRLFAGTADKKVRTTALPLVHAPAWWAGVWQLRQPSRDAVYLLALTGWRHEAVLRMRWEQLDLVAGLYQVNAGDHGWKGYVGPMALSSYVVDCLQDRWNEASQGDRAGGWVFPARHGSSPHMKDVGEAVRKAGAGVGDEGLSLTPHDLRRTFATVAEVVLGGNLGLVGRLLGHAAPSVGIGQAGQGSGVTAGYVVRDVQGERASAQLVAEALLGVGAVLPLAAETKALFEARGVVLSDAVWGQ